MEAQLGENFKSDGLLDAIHLLELYVLMFFLYMMKGLNYTILCVFKMLGTMCIYLLN